MDDAVARSQFLFGLDEPPADIAAFFAERDVADADRDLDGLGGGDDRDLTGMRTALASMIAAGGGDIFWEAAQRLTAAGVERVDALDQIATALFTGLHRQDADDAA